MQSPNRHFGEYPPTAICAHRPPITNCVRVQQFRLLEVVTSGERRNKWTNYWRKAEVSANSNGRTGLLGSNFRRRRRGLLRRLSRRGVARPPGGRRTRHGEHGDVRALIRDTPSLATIGHTYAPTEFAHGRKQGPSRSASPASGLLIRNRRCPSSISTRSPRPGEPAFAGSSRPPVGAACRRPNLRQ